MGEKRARIRFVGMVEATMKCSSCLDHALFCGPGARKHGVTVSLSKRETTRRCQRRNVAL